MSNDNKEWFSQREMYELIIGLKEEMTETKHLISHYNGLYESVKKNNNDILEVREEVLEVNKKVNKINFQNQGKTVLVNKLYQFSGWLVAIIGLLLTFLLK